MDKIQFAALICLPKVWVDHNMYPDQIFEGQKLLLNEEIAELVEGEEVAYEHYRNAVYVWWIDRATSNELQLVKTLVMQEPDQKLREWLNRRIEKRIIERP